MATHLKRTLVLGVVGGSLAVWIAAAATSSVRRVAPVELPKPQAIDASGADLASEVTRLRDRLRPAIAPVQSRDLFHYSARPAARRAPAPVDALIAEPASPLPVAPLLKLVGIAEDHSDAGPVRTAILSGAGELFLVKVGDAVTSRYRVGAIEADAVDLIEPDGRTTLHLQLK